MLATEAKLPMDPIEKAEPTDPIDMKEPYEPIDRQELREYALRTDCRELNDRIDKRSSELAMIQVSVASSNYSTDSERMRRIRNEVELRTETGDECRPWPHVIPAPCHCLQAFVAAHPRARLAMTRHHE